MLKTKCKIALLLMLSSVLIYVQAQDILSSGVSCDEKKIIVNTHNLLREKIAKGKVPGQPKARNLQKIAWDDQLAELAQNYANRMELDYNHNREDARFEVGENKYNHWDSSSEINTNWGFAVIHWFNQHKIYHFMPFDSHLETGQYTQMLWGDTKYVGCGFTFFNKDENFHRLYVCNYGPAGNIPGKYPYILGSTCESLVCSEQCSTLYGQECQNLL